VRILLLTLSFTLSLPTLSASDIADKPPETFSARAEARVAGGVAATELRIHVDRYTTDKERQVAVRALETGGSAGLTAALRYTPSNGYVEVGDRRWAIRYAWQEPTPKGRQILVVLDQPMLFLPGVELNPKAREGFELAVIQFEVDQTGTGQGTMSAAARIQSFGPAGVELTDDSDEPITLVTVTKIAS
jgi:hypothetical protein